MSKEIAAITVSDIERMASAIAVSKLFGMKSKEEAMALMLIAQAEGTHPALAARDYNIIQGKPALKADAMLARFQSAGGKIEWLELSDTRVSANFSHPAGGTAMIDWDMKRAQSAQLGGKEMWKKFPRQMLRARVISEGIRTVFPGVVIGVYTPEEVQDFDMVDVTPKPEPVFANSALRNKFCDNVLKAFTAATTQAELDELVKLYKPNFEKMDAGSEYDVLGVDELRKQYSVAKVRLAEADKTAAAGIRELEGKPADDWAGDEIPAYLAKQS